MMRSERKHMFLHEFLVLLLVIVIAKCGTKIWPVSLALFLAVLVHGVRKLMLWRKQRHAFRPEQSQTPPEPVRQPAPVMERDLVAIAFGLLQRRITERITAEYPGARWIWERPGARKRFAAGDPLTIQLSRAGGYQSAIVLVHDLQFRGLSYLPAVPDPEEKPEEPPEEEETGPESVDYGLLAFEWVEANLQRLNRQAAGAKAKLHIGFRIPAEELPHGDSWPDVCKALLQNGFDVAEPVADGILVRFKNDEEETETA